MGWLITRNFLLWKVWKRRGEVKADFTKFLQEIKQMFYWFMQTFISRHISARYVIDFFLSSQTKWEIYTQKLNLPSNYSYYIFVVSLFTAHREIIWVKQTTDKPIAGAKINVIRWRNSEYRPMPRANRAECIFDAHASRPSCRRMAVKEMPQETYDLSFYYITTSVLARLHSSLPTTLHRSRVFLAPFREPSQCLAAFFPRCPSPSETQRIDIIFPKWLVTVCIAHVYLYSPKSNRD